MKIPGRIGRYEVLSEIARGGMATVYHARDPRFRREVAIKVLPRQFTHDPMFRARFQREAETIASLDHPAIVLVYDFGEEDQQPYLVMRYMSGGSLADRISKGPMSVAEAARILRPIGAALDEAHANGIIHRDLKPGNILFDHRDNAYLSDFGIVKLAEATVTFTGNAIIGTPAYMSPEQAKGVTNLDGRSDIYTLGVILFQMLTGRTPYQSDTPLGYALKHVGEPIPHARDIIPDLPYGCEEIVMRAMAKEREERYATAGELAAAVTAVAHRIRSAADLAATLTEDTEVWNGETESITPLPPPPISQRRGMPAWGWWLILAVPVLGLLLWGGGRLLGGGGASPTAPVATMTPVAAVARVLETATPAPSPTMAPTSTLEPTSTPTRTPVRTNTPSPAAPATATATASGSPVPLVLVNVLSVNLRRGPGINFPIIAVLYENEIVQVLARNGNGTWYNVELEDGTTGWLAAGVTSPVGNAAMDNIPVAATIPSLSSGTTTTATVTRTPRPTATRTLPPGATATSAAQPGATATRTPRPTATRTPLPTATRTPLPPNTPTNTPQPANTPTNTPLPANTPTNTPQPPDTPTNTPQPPDTPTNTPQPPDTPTNTPQPPDTPTETPTPDTPVP